MIKGPIIPGYRLPPISPDARARAEETWRDNRRLHEAALAASRGETPPPLPQQAAPNPVVNVADDPDDYHRLERAILNRAYGVRLPRRSSYKLQWGDFMEYLRTRNQSVVADLWVQHQAGGSINLEPEMVVVFVRGRSGAPDLLSGVRLLTGSRAAQEPFESYIGRLHFVAYGKGTTYILSNAKGADAYEAALEWMKGVGIVPASPVEEAIAMARLDAYGRTDDASRRLTWGDVTGYATSQGSRLGMRILQLQPDTLSARFSDDSRFVIAMAREGAGDDATTGSFHVMTPEEARKRNLIPKYAQLEMSFIPESRQHIVTSATGKGALELGVAWVRGMGVAITHPSQTAMLARMWGTRLGRNDPQPSWTAFCEYLSAGGLLSLVKTWRAATGRVPVREMTLLAKKSGAGTDVSACAIRVVTSEEADRLAISADTARVDFVRDGDLIQVVTKKNKGAKELTTAIEHHTPRGTDTSGGLSLAPDADAMDQAAQLVAALSKETYGNLEDQVCTPEPLFTPAEVMQVLPLIQPADAVDLPNMGGYLTMDPEDLKLLQIPPSDKIPVITGAKEGLAATIAAMVLGAIAVRFGGAVLMRTPLGEPAFGSGSIFLAPRDRREYDGT